MLPRINRLKRRLDFREVLSSGEYAKGRFLSLRYIRLPPEDLSILVGFIVSKKFSKRATDRNLIKRQLRAIFREILGHIVGGVKIVVIVSRPEIDANFVDLRDDLIELLTRAKLLYGY